MLSKSRLETFSDGVFAIAITLLVLTITAPTDYADLGSQLLEKWPALAAYAVSFLVIGIEWLNHHTVFSSFDRVDKPLFYLNLGLLASVVLVPYPTGVLGEALIKTEGMTVAAVAYSALMTVNAVWWALVWLYASSGRRLLADAFPEEGRREATLAFAGGPLLYAATILVAFVNAYACLVAHALLALYYALDPLSWRRANRA